MIIFKLIFLFPRHFFFFKLNVLMINICVPISMVLKLYIFYTLLCCSLMYTTHRNYYIVMCHSMSEVPKCGIRLTKTNGKSEEIRRRFHEMLHLSHAWPANSQTVSAIAVSSEPSLLAHK